MNTSKLNGIEWKQENILGIKSLNSKAGFITLDQIEQNNTLYDEKALTRVIED